MGLKKPLTKAHHYAILGQKSPTGVQKENKTDYIQGRWLKYFDSITLHKGIKEKVLGYVFYACSQTLGSKLGQQLLPLLDFSLEVGQNKGS